LRAPIPRLPGDDPVSRSTNAIVARAMAKKPDDRYASALEMRQELVSLRTLAAEQEDRTASSSAPAARRRRTTAVAVVGVAVGAIVLAATGWLVRGPGDAPASQGDDSRSQATPSPSAASARRCWDGTAARQGADCPAPSGLRGLQWVYPSFKHDRADCRRVKQPLSPRKLRAYFCPFNADNPDEGVRYSEWVSASAASEIITRDFRPWTEDLEPAGSPWSVWVREDRDEQGWFSSAVAYRDWPFSAEVLSNTRRGATLACNNIIKLREPDTYRSVTSLCGSPA